MVVIREQHREYCRVIEEFVDVRHPGDPIEVIMKSYQSYRCPYLPYCHGLLTEDELRQAELEADQFPYFAELIVE